MCPNLYIRSNSNYVRGLTEALYATVYMQVVQFGLIPLCRISRCSAWFSGQGTL